MAKSKNSPDSAALARELTEARAFQAATAWARYRACGGTRSRIAEARHRLLSAALFGSCGSSTERTWGGLAGASADSSTEPLSHHHRSKSIEDRRLGLGTNPSLARPHDASAGCWGSLRSPQQPVHQR